LLRSLARTAQSVGVKPMDGIVGGDDANPNTGLVLMPGFPVVADLGPGFYAFLVFDAVDEVASGREPGAVIKVEADIVEQNRGFAMFGGLDGVGGLTECSGIDGESRAARNIGVGRKAGGCAGKKKAKEHAVRQIEPPRM